MLTLAQRDSKKSVLSTFLEEKLPYLKAKVNNKFAKMVINLIYILWVIKQVTSIFLDKLKDPENMKVQFNRNLETSFGDTNEDDSGSFLSYHWNADTNSNKSNERALVQIQTE